MDVHLLMGRIKLFVGFEPHDVWVGFYWRWWARGRSPSCFKLWICVLPMLPIRLEVWS